MHPNRQTSEKNEWFEKMYQGRSRNEEIECEYLRKERDFVARFGEERSIRGPSLEIGCGVGLFAEQVGGFIGLEYSLEGLLAPGFEPFDRIAADAACLPFKDAAMQLIFSFNTLEHIAQIDLVFSELDRVCAPGGYLLLRPAWHSTKYHTELVDILPYSKLSLRKRIVKAMVPLLRTRFYKFFSHVPWRLWRRLTAGTPPALKWTPLVPYHGPLWEADTDA
ncbi:MAG: class I SAM-dependent methyltransferase, partial [Verrucomicrobiota bacterium]